MWRTRPDEGKQKCPLDAATSSGRVEHPVLERNRSRAARMRASDAGKSTAALHSVQEESVL